MSTKKRETYSQLSYRTTVRADPLRVSHTARWEGAPLPLFLLLYMAHFCPCPRTARPRTAHRRRHPARRAERRNGGSRAVEFDVDNDVRHAVHRT